MIFNINSTRGHTGSSLVYTKCSERISRILSDFQVVNQVCQMLIAPVSLIFCGHLGDPIKLDGAAMGISVSRTLLPVLHEPGITHLCQWMMVDTTRCFP